jgi:tetratricopeptide (TPR) repeat protein
MPRGFLFLLCSTVVLSQVPPREPFEVAIQLYRDARAVGNFDQAHARREEARSLLALTPLDSPMLPSRVQMVAQLYQSSGWHAQARAVVEDELSRAISLVESHPVRIQLSNMLADFWQQNGNLLRALSYREKIVAALEASPASASPDAAQPRLNALTGTAPVRRVAGGFGLTGAIQAFSPGRGANSTQAYQQLSDLYRQLGRPEAAAKIVAKMRSLIQNDPRALAAFYESQGNLDEAVALYKKLAEQAAANPQSQVWEAIGPLQAIANLYQRDQRWDDAAATLEQAASRLEASGGAGAHNQAVGMRLNIANLLQQAGQSQAADKLYQTLAAETANDDSNGTLLQVLQGYAAHLSNTKRPELAEDLLKGYLANHADLQPGQEMNILFSLSGIERNAGRKELADEFQHAAMEKQRAAQPQNPPQGLVIGPDFQKAQLALNQGNLDEAVNLALHAMASASLARDGEQVGWQVPSIAAGLAGWKAPEKAEQLYHQLLALLHTWSTDNTMPLIQVQQQYARFLIGQKDRWGEAPAAIERYRENLVLAEGAETSDLEQVMNLRIDFARARGALGETVQIAEELLAFEESLSGTTSANYMRAAQTLANVYQSAGNPERALALHRQIVAIADLTLSPNETPRGFVRINAAFAFANARRFDEAEGLVNEALAIGERMRPPQSKLFAAQAEQIRRMKTAAESGSVQTDGVVHGGIGGGWFEMRTFQAPNGTSNSMATVPGTKSAENSGK